jgi:hypothetical protein
VPCRAPDGFLRGAQLRLKVAMERFEFEMWQKVQAEKKGLASNAEEEEHEGTEARRTDPH